MVQRPDSVPEDDGMSVWEHIGELRRRVVYSLIVFAAGMVGGLFGAEPLFDYLVAAAPADNLELNAFSPWDAISLYMKFAFLISLVVAIPFAFYQLWAFVKPALGKREQRATLRYIPGALAMFLIGLSFAYFVVFPMAYYFTERVTVNMGLKQTYGLSQYFSFLFNLLIPISLLFELPLVIMFLTRIGILNPQILRKMRRLAWFVMCVIGVTITPPDVISDMLVAVPLIVLYEFSVMLSMAAYRKRIAARMAREAALDLEDD
ncbi:twin-arginine translocase subunit TatC [Cohnella sp. CFH 77786]|uniref:twin-arginine translocase subunit TatC n=1 Tax=Cohnella sp. CFH 77786 TaxID=2662265 RepID=UPI001C60EA57|nr:twin-arginine translocase subunit TatC [Cohnella sp. CFH 77786]MBW5448303.1 twin-arginine translocase subunit TatC [Cohnella sp. CFH 77786]